MNDTTITATLGHASRPLTTTTPARDQHPDRATDTYPFPSKTPPRTITQRRVRKCDRSDANSETPHPTRSGRAAAACRSTRRFGPRAPSNTVTAGP